MTETQGMLGSLGFLTFAVMMGFLVHRRERKKATWTGEIPKRAKMCGHELVDKTVCVSGKSIKLTFPSSKDSDYCADCMEEHAFQCSPTCSTIVFPGTEIAVHVAHDGTIPEGAKPFLGHPFMWITCRLSCRGETSNLGTWHIGPDGKGYPRLTLDFESEISQEELIPA